MAPRLIRLAALALGVAALALLAASGPGVRLELWSWRTGLSLFRWAAYLGFAASVAAIVALLLAKARALGVAAPVFALTLGLAAGLVPLELLRQARAVPPINDISTDTASPPQYVTTLRPYPGEEFARQQRAAYPELEPLRLAMPAPQAFARALAAAEAMGWDIVHTDPAGGRIEALDTTKWFGFKDDIAVRVTPAEGGARIDVRSRSRVGRSDLGTNARRIRGYLERLK